MKWLVFPEVTDIVEKKETEIGQGEVFVCSIQRGIFFFSLTFLQLFSRHLYDTYQRPIIVNLEYTT